MRKENHPMSHKDLLGIIESRWCKKKKNPTSQIDSLGLIEDRRDEKNTNKSLGVAKRGRDEVGG